ADVDRIQYRTRTQATVAAGEVKQSTARSSACVAEQQTVIEALNVDIFDGVLAINDTCGFIRAVGCDVGFHGAGDAMHSAGGCLKIDALRRTGDPASLGLAKVACCVTEVGIRSGASGTGADFHANPGQIEERDVIQV